MTPSREEIVSSLEGAWGLARREPAALQRFNLTVDGFWNSFYAAVLCAPGYLLLVAQQYAQRGAEAGVGTILIVETLAYAVGWLVFPATSIVITRLLGLGHRYAVLVIAANWSMVLQVGLLVVALLLSGLMPAAQGGYLTLAATLVALVYQWQVVRTALATTGLIAFAIVVIDIILSVLLNSTTDRLLQVG
ncbi:MAG: hypothetical protein U1E14_06440 [Geminicoccaceae bacterium]